MLSVRGLSFAYGPLPVLHDVSFDAAAGQVCGLFGPNGCGKTTLFRCCLGLERGSADQVTVDGRSLAPLAPADRARLLAYVPQEHKPPFPLAVREVVMLGRTPYLGWLGRASAGDRDAVDGALERLGLADLASRAYDRLSGGQRQLVLIARAVAQQTPVILLDEPASGLDFRNQVRVWRLLGELAAAGTAVVCCTHDPNHVAWFCHRTVVMHRGRVVAEGAPATALNLATLDRLYPEACAISRVEGLCVVRPRGLAAGRHGEHD